MMTKTERDQLRKELTPSSEYGVTPNHKRCLVRRSDVKDVEQ